MRIVVLGVCVLGAAFLVGGTEVSRAGGKKDPKYTISEVMKKAHGKNGVLNKVASGKGDKADAEQLLDLYVALAQNKPPVGDAASWKRFTDGLTAAARAAVSGDAAAGKLLKKASNCKACHSVHKG